MSEFIVIFGKISYIAFIIGSVFFGFSLGVNALITRVINKINNESDVNYLSIESDKRKECDAVILKAKTSCNEYLEQAKQLAKVKKANKIRSFFKLKLKPEPQTTISTKDVLVEMIENVAKVFYGDSDERAFLKFSEREIYFVLDTLKIRLKEILSSTGVIWLKELPISFFLTCFNVYKSYDKIKNGIFFTVVVWLIDVCVWFVRFFSPVSAGKFLVKSASGSGLNSVITNTVVTVLAKELAVIYRNKRVMSN